MPSVLLLNADAQPLTYLPLSTISWQSAIKAVFSNKARVLETYSKREIRSANFRLQMPSVIILTRYHKQPQRAKFTRRNLYMRDNYCCQYCGDKFQHGELTIDHVIPKSRGGKLIWENSVTACSPCNVRKSNKMQRPLKTPHLPSWYEINNSARNYNLTIPDEIWQQYLQWPEDLLVINKNVASTLS